MAIRPAVSRTYLHRPMHSRKDRAGSPGSLCMHTLLLHSRHPPQHDLPGPPLKAARWTQEQGGCALEGPRAEAVVHAEGVEAVGLPHGELLQAALYELHGVAPSVHGRAGVQGWEHLRTSICAWSSGPWIWACGMRRPGRSLRGFRKLSTLQRGCLSLCRCRQHTVAEACVGAVHQQQCEGSAPRMSSRSRLLCCTCGCVTMLKGGGLHEQWPRQSIAGTPTQG